MRERRKSGADTFGVSITGKLSNEIELLSYLNSLHSQLKAVDQEISTKPKGLQETANQLVAKKVLQHSDKDVQLLVLCCVADILRLYAPEAPFKDADAVMVFAAIASQLKRLATCDMKSPSGKLLQYLTTSLAEVKSCVVPIMLQQSHVAGAQKVAHSFISTIIDSVNPELPEPGKITPFIVEL